MQGWSRASCWFAGIVWEGRCPCSSPLGYRACQADTDSRQLVLLVARASVLGTVSLVHPGQYAVKERNSDVTISQRHHLSALKLCPPPISSSPLSLTSISSGCQHGLDFNTAPRLRSQSQRGLNLDLDTTPNPCLHSGCQRGLDLADPNLITVPRPRPPYQLSDRRGLNNPQSPFALDDSAATAAVILFCSRPLNERVCANVDSQIDSSENRRQLSACEPCFHQLVLTRCKQNQAGRDARACHTNPGERDRAGYDARGRRHYTRERDVGARLQHESQYPARELVPGGNRGSYYK